MNSATGKSFCHETSRQCLEPARLIADHVTDATETITRAILLAWIGSALIFGAIHLPTYNWNIIQALLLIGPIRLVLTLAYMKTKSIWASTIAHIVNDWSMFILLIVVSAISK
ncbi:CPBP family intramembrane glutamic endopeptidase [Sphingomonas sp. UYAg733]